MGLFQSKLTSSAGGAEPLQQEVQESTASSTPEDNVSGGGPAAFQGARDFQIHGGTFNVAENMHINNHFHPGAPPNDDLVLKMQDWLNSKVDFQGIQLETLKKRTPETGNWLLEGEEFRTWLDSTGGILWGIGIPGSGKTVIASTVIEYIQTRADELEPGEMSFAYAYSRYTEEIGVEEILLGLAGQQLERYPSKLARFVGPLYRQHRNGKTKPTQKELVDLLVMFSTVFKLSFYMLDGVDEARKAVQFNLVQVLRSIKAHFFLTSRPLDILQSELPEAKIFHVVAHDKDIILLIAEVIKDNPEFRLLLKNEALKQEVIAKICEKSAGMFLHATLQLEALQDCVNEDGIRSKLDELPVGLVGIYKATIDRIENQAPERSALAKRILTLVVYAKQPLEVEELQYAAAMDLEAHTFCPGSIVDEALLLRVCCGLIYVEDRDNDVWSIERQRIVRLIHFTAKDALHQILLKDFPTPHAFFASTCISRLISCNFHKSDIKNWNQLDATFDKKPFLHYAYNYWHVHARQCDPLSPNIQCISQFLARCQSFPLHIGHPNYFMYLDCVAHGTGIHVASSYGLLHTLNNISDPNIPTLDYNFTPLLLALWFSPLISSTNSAMVLLNQPGININAAETTVGFTPLVLASDLGLADVVECLLKCPDLKVNSRCNNGDTALICAVWGVHRNVVDLLIQHGKAIDVNIRGTFGRTALGQAASMGDRHLIDLLLQHEGIDVDIADQLGFTPPMLAAKHADVLKLLLEHTLQTQLGQDQLIWAEFMQASKQGHLDHLKQLLESSDIPINDTDQHGYTALILASFYGHESVVQWLLQLPTIQVNIQAENGYTALIAAAKNCHTTVVQHLLAVPGIEVNQCCDIQLTRGSALIVASANGGWDIVQLLLQYPEINVNVESGTLKGTTLMFAVEANRWDIVWQLLLNPGINVNAMDYSGNIPLISVVEQDKLDIVEQLLQHPGIDVNGRDEDGRTALMWASRKGQSDIVGQLLQYSGINMNATDNHGSTALTLASEYGHLTIVEKLLQFPGIQLELANRDGDTALILAESSKEDDHPTIAQLIREALAKQAQLTDA